MLTHCLRQQSAVESSDPNRGQTLCGILGYLAGDDADILTRFGWASEAYRISREIDHISCNRCRKSLRAGRIPAQVITQIVSHAHGVVLRPVRVVSKEILIPGGFSVMLGYATPGGMSCNDGGFPVVSIDGNWVKAPALGDMSQVRAIKALRGATSLRELLRVIGQ